jgi:predicted house-cleaning noncanonical NTP pyrophosphatase (MazG superfamily)
MNKVKPIDYVDSFKRANQDEEMHELADEGLGDYLEMINNPATVSPNNPGTVKLSSIKTHPMNNVRDKIVEAQVIAKDATTQVSAMINQDNLDPKQLKKLRERLEELTDVLNNIDEDQFE